MPFEVDVNAWIDPVDHVDDLPKSSEVETGTACWVGPDVFQLSEIVGVVKVLPESVEWKGRTFLLEDWGSWVCHDGTWTKLIATKDAYGNAITKVDS